MSNEVYGFKEDKCKVLIDTIIQFYFTSYYKNKN